MKKLTTISLFIFFCVVTAILTAGLVFYQNNKNNSSQVGSNVIAQKDVSKLVSSGIKILDMKEVVKHNNQNDCWLLISGKVYDITSYFGSHPGGSGTMSATCGKDATDAYKTKDPYASTAGAGTAHSSRARNLLDNYYIGDLNQKIDQQTITQNIQKAKLTPTSVNTEEEYEDD